MSRSHETEGRGQGEGEFLHVPYDWRRPTWRRLKNRLWNVTDERVFVPKVFGWGWTLNFHALLRKLGLTKGSRFKSSGG